MNTKTVVQKSVCPICENRQSIPADRLEISLESSSFRSEASQPMPRQSNDGRPDTGTRSMIAADTPVFWMPRNRAGEPSGTVIAARTRGDSFVIERNNGERVECAILSTNRLCPIAELTSTRPDLKPIPRPTKPPAEPTPQATKPTAPKEKPPVVPPAQQPAAVPAHVCDVLAIDFLNVLVRAFHAGKPTETHAVRSMFQTVAHAIRTLKPARVVFALDGGHKRRSELLPEYKAHRPPSDPALQHQKQLAETAIRIAGFEAIRVVDWEADDVLATLATQFPDTVVASCDKDLLSLTATATRCRIFHPWNGGEFMTAEAKLGISPALVSDFLALCGDTSDGIPGVKGIGPKTAAALLEEFGSLESIIVAAITGTIKGAAGAKIREQRDAALLCRQVVELNSRLPLPLPEPHAWQPVADWQNQLQNLKLGSVAAIVQSLIDERQPTILHQREDFLSAPTGKGEQGAKCGFNGNPTRPLNASDEVQVAQVTTPAESRPNVAHCKDSAGPVVRRSITEPIREGLTHEQRFGGPDCGAIHAWEAGRRSAPRRKTENPWKKNTWQHEAWQQGFELLDLSVDTSKWSAAEC